MERKLTQEEPTAVHDEARAAYDEYVAGLAALRAKGDGILAAVQRVLVEEKIRQIESGKLSMI